MDKADDCLRLVRQAREAADQLEAMASEFWAKAVEIDTDRDRKAQKSARPRSK
ncbi:MAG: hypothetical protein AB7E67_13305 [Xanthobacteraceae bacterium]